MERYLALDVGDKRIGLAVSDDLGLTAQPIGVIMRVGWGPDIRQIHIYAEKYKTKSIICGLPLLLDGSRGEQANKAVAFAEQLTKAGYSIQLWDERMTTVSAARVLIEGGLKRKDRKQVIDQTAAAIILQSFLDSKRSEGGICNGSC